MNNEKEVKGYQKGFLNAVGISVEELLTTSEDNLWDMILSFCSLNDVALIIDDEDRLLLGNFSSLEKNDQLKIIKSFHWKVLQIKKDLK